MIIYLDLLFFKEILFNTIIIFLTGKIINQRVNLKKVMLGSLLGALYTICLLLINPNLCTNSILQVVCATVILLIVFKNKTIYELMENTIIFYIVTYIVGGLHTYTQNQNKNNFFYMAALILVIPKIIKKHKKKYKLDSYYGKLILNIEGEKNFLKVLIDTGHSLLTCYDEPVIILSNKYSIEKLKNTANNRRVSYKTINENEVCVDGIKEEGIELEYRNEKYKNDAVIIISNVCFENYDAIIGLDFFEKASKNSKKEKRKENGNIIFNKK